jgi:predicted esterase
MLRILFAALLFATPLIAEEKKRISAEEIFEKHRSGETLSYFEINRLNSECRLVLGTTRILALGGKSIVEDANGGPVLVYIDGDVGGRPNGKFEISSRAFEALKALRPDGTFAPNWLYSSRMGCKGTLLEYGYFGMPAVYGARSGTYGTPGNYGEDIYTVRETEAIVVALDEMREVGVQSFILFGFSGGAQAATMAAAGRDDVELIVSAGGMLSRIHHPHTYFENDPIRHVATMPPTMIVHSTEDQEASFAGAKAFHDAMLAAGRQSTFHKVSVGHFATTIEAKKILGEYLGQ